MRGSYFTSQIKGWKTQRMFLLSIYFRCCFVTKFLKNEFLYLQKGFRYFRTNFYCME